MIQAISEVVDEKALPFWQEKTGENLYLMQRITNLHKGLCKESKLSRAEKMNLIIAEMEVIKENVNPAAQNDAWARLLCNAVDYLFGANLAGKEMLASIGEDINSFYKRKKHGKSTSS